MKCPLIGFNGIRSEPVSGRSSLGNGYRTYHPALMRFNVPDSWSPFGAGGMNPYVYCRDDPVNRTDPSGHMSLGQWIGMGVGLIAGIAFSIVTDGAALPAVASLMATMAGDAAIGAGSEIVAEAADGQRINWNQVGIAAGISAAATLFTGTFRLGNPSMKGERIITQWHDEENLVPLFRSRFTTEQKGRAIKSVNHMFDDTYKNGKRLNIAFHGRYSQELQYTQVYRGVRGVNHIMSGSEFAAWLRDVKGVNFSAYAHVRLISCLAADGGESSFAAGFAREAHIPTKSFEGLVTTVSYFQYYANMTNKYNFPVGDPLKFNVKQANSRLSVLRARGKTLFTLVKEDGYFDYQPRHFDSDGHLLD